jgi:benzylsuccinate CoA-transferase BbsF subunit
MKIDLAQVESTINFLGPAIINFAVTGQDPKPIGNRSLSQSPHNLFRCKEPDSWCAIAAQTEEEWLALANVIGGQELACNPSFHGVQNRLEKTQELESIVSDWACHHTVAEAVAILQKVGVTTARVACSKDLLTDDLHLKEREFWQQIDHPEMGVTTFTSPPYRIDGHRLQLKRPPLIGEHTDAVLRDILGCTDEEIRSLNSAGVLK